MSDSYLPYQSPTIVDKKLDSETLTVGANTVERERIQISGTGATDIAPITVDDGLLVNFAKNAIDTYEMCFSVVAAGSGDAVEIVGSGSRVGRILEIYVSEPTVARTFEFLKRSTAASGGASTSPTSTPLDSANNPSTVVIKNYTVVPASGTLVGSPIFKKILATSQHIDKTWVDGGGQSPTLRSTSETICINVDGATNFDVYLRWTEAST